MEEEAGRYMIFSATPHTPLAIYMVAGNRLAASLFSPSRAGDGAFALLSLCDTDILLLTHFAFHLPLFPAACIVGLAFW